MLAFFLSARLSYNFWISSSLSLFRNVGGDHHYHKETSIGSLFSFTENTDICSVTASRDPFHLWAEHLPTILAASRLSLDNEFSLRFVTASVLEQIFNRIPRSVKALPQDDMSALLQKMEGRFRYLQQMKRNRMSGPKSYAEPIKITILGGSVTAGVRCETGIPILRNQRCAWPTRLEQFINNMVQLYLDPNNLKPDDDSAHSFVKVHTLAAGGTNTGTGQAILEFDILPEEAQKPDILINAYSTNDMHVLTFNEAASSNQTIRERVFDMNQDFIRTAKSCGVASPLVIILDDYLGNEQRELLKTQELAQSVHVLANYYGIGFVSYADAVRDLVYSDTHETMFSPAGWYVPPKSRMQREIHPGQGMHIATAWIMAYNIFVALTNHCNKQLIARKMLQIDMSESKLPDGWGEKKLNGKTLEQHFLDARPKKSQVSITGLPPKLKKDLLLDEISRSWQKSNQKAASYSCDQKVCTFSWVSGIPWMEENAIRDLFDPILSTKDWDVVDDSNGRGKFGWMPIASPSTNNPAFILEFTQKFKADALSSLTVFYMKSYGEKWDFSEVSVSIEKQMNQKWHEVVSPIQLFGHHNKTTSEMYSETIRFEPTASRRLRVSIILIGGLTFKVMGIAACSGTP